MTQIPRPPVLMDALGGCATFLMSVALSGQAPRAILVDETCGVSILWTDTQGESSHSSMQSAVWEHLLVRAGVPLMLARQVSNLTSGDKAGREIAEDILARLGATAESIAAQATAGVWERDVDRFLWLALGRFW